MRLEGSHLNAACGASAFEGYEVRAAVVADIVRLCARWDSGHYAALVKNGENETHEAAVQLLIHSLRMEVHRRRDHSKVRVAVIPAHDSGMQTKFLCEALGLPRCRRKLLRTYFNSVTGPDRLFPGMQRNTPDAHLHAFSAAHIDNISQQETHYFFGFGSHRMAQTDHHSIRRNIYR